MATIYDVARKAGVSPKTVSRVLNAGDPVSARTREAVEAAIRELNYQPSSAARTMRSNRSGLIGLITQALSMDLGDPQPRGLPDLFIVQGIQQGLRQSDKTLLIADTGGDPHRAPALIDTFLRYQVEGLIYVTDSLRQVNLPTLPQDRPVVLVNCYDGKGTPSVIPDDERGQYSLIRELIAAGHERIAYLTLQDGVTATARRTGGYRRALSEAGIDFDKSLVMAGDMDGNQAETQLLWDAIDRVLNLPEPPTALCFGNDRMALKGFGILRSRGLRIPDDISVAGYDNYKIISETLYPPLTTVELPYETMGVRAAERLLAAIADGGAVEPSSPLLVSGPVHWRGSTTKRSGQVVSLDTQWRTPR